MVRFQKVTRNLFLTLRGHNVHRQQRRLSKFLMRYRQFASHAYCGTAGPVSKMASQREKAFCVLRFEVSRSVITVHETHAALSCGKILYRSIGYRYTLSMCINYCSSTPTLDTGTRCNVTLYVYCVSC